MAALLSALRQPFRWILSLFGSHESPAVHQRGLPLPQVIHEVIGDEWMKQFAEVLVIGDIHGCYDELIELLNKINDNYNTCAANDGNNDNNNRILKLFVGDLVNKGPKSSEVLDFLLNNSENCRSVRGNHDEVVIERFLNFETNGESALEPKNKWIKDLKRKQMDYLISMPYTISIPSLNAVVVHAGIVANTPLNRQRYWDMTEMRNIIESEDNKQKILCPTLNIDEGKPWVSYWSGPQHIYFGHDARRKLQINQFSTGLDTGCVYGNQLTAHFIDGPRKGDFITVNANRVYSPPKTSQTSLQ